MMSPTIAAVIARDLQSEGFAYVGSTDADEVARWLDENGVKYTRSPTNTYQYVRFDAAGDR